MKRFISYICIASVFLTFFSCQKTMDEGNPADTAIVKTMHVDGNEWLSGNGTKTAYSPGQGVVWTGSESFAVYYGNTANYPGTDGNAYLAGKVSGLTRTGDKTYTFSHPVIDGAQAYDYCAITPDLTSTSDVMNNGNSVTFKLSPVQMPESDTFDPNYDILIARGQRGVSAMDEISFSEFKRLTAPLRLCISDSNNAAGGEKIFAASMTFSEPADPGTLFGLTGRYTVDFGYEYDECGFSAVRGPVNAVSAVYASGLEMTSGIWPVWYMVKPADFTSGGTLTVSITTETRTISRTISLTGGASIVSGLNNLDFDMSADNSFMEAHSIYQDFSAMHDLTGEMTSSDGNTYTWTFDDNCSVYTDALLPSGLRVEAGGKVTLPEISGRQISKVRLYAHPVNPVRGCTVSLSDGEAFDFNSFVTNTNGVLEIIVPADEYGTTLSLSVSGESAVIVGMALETVGADEDGTWDGTPAATYDGGSGTEADPYQIATPGQLALMRNDINSAVSNITACYRLTADIDLCDIAWTPAGVTSNHYYNGTFDGDNHKISGLNVSVGNGDTYAGLFGYSRGTVKNLILDAPEVSSSSGIGTSYTGAVVGQGVNMAIENCHVHGGTIDVSSATGQNVYSGSIAGQAAATITACSSTASLKGGTAGGIVGYFRGSLTITGCCSGVTMESSSPMGGIIGLTQTNQTPVVTGCYSISSMSGDGDKGGLAGRLNGGSFQACYYTGTMTPAGNKSSAAGASNVDNIGSTEAEAMNSAISLSGWSYAAGTGILPYVMTKN